MQSEPNKAHLQTIKGSCKYSKLKISKQLSWESQNKYQLRATRHFNKFDPFYDVFVLKSAISH